MLTEAKHFKPVKPILRLATTHAQTNRQKKTKIIVLDSTTFIKVPTTFFLKYLLSTDTDPLQSYYD